MFITLDPIDNSPRARHGSSVKHDSKIYRQAQWRTIVEYVESSTETNPAPTSHRLVIEKPGRVDYNTAWQAQQQRQEQRIADHIDDTVMLLEHPSVYTAGRRTEKWALPNDGTPVVTTDRGGQITWHGPGQLVGYPIVKMRQRIDVVAYVRRIEDMIVEVCKEFGVDSASGRMQDRTGVWLPEDSRGPARKICAIGVRVRWAVTMHGFALNCNPDMSHFDRIAPCAITDASVTSLSQELGRQVTVAEVMPVVEKHLPLILERDA